MQSKDPNIVTAVPSSERTAKVERKPLKEHQGMAARSPQARPKSRLHPNITKAARYLAENRLFSLATTLLTVYALCGDDMRIICTNKPADPIFDGLTVFCVAVFAFEIVLSMLGKDDYAFSFFFTLDVVSTLTLLLDLTWVAVIFQGDDEDQAQSDGAAGSAKVGARTSRVVRVLRLVRIVKIYKAIYEARQLQKKKEELARLEQMGHQPGQDDDAFDDLEVRQANMTKAPGKESRVGKKLSELTTRRVIGLVLVMMLVLPYLKVEDSQQFPTSAAYGADLINEAFQNYLERNTTESKLRYDKTLLSYIYYHNWYTFRLQFCPKQAQFCSKQFDSHVFWVGFVSKNEEVLNKMAARASIDTASVNAMEAEVKASEADGDEAWVYLYGSMPQQVQSTMGTGWQQDCPGKRGLLRRGFSVLSEKLNDGEFQVHYAAPCPEDLRSNERKKWTPRLNVDTAEYEAYHFAFYFDLRPFVVIEAYNNLGTVVFVCFSLLIASIGFTNDANRLVLYPVENMIAKVETIRANPLAAMKVADEEFKVEEINRAKAAKQEKTKVQALKEAIGCAAKQDGAEIMETVILEKTIIKLGSLLALGFGEAGANIIEHNMHGVDSACVDAMVEGTRVECIIGATRIRDFSTATEVLQAKVMTFVNQIAEIVHGVVDEFHGAANKNNGDTFLMIWRMSQGGEKAAKLADMSMLAFTRILGAIHRTPVLAAYRGHPGLQQRLGKNCRVNLSSGLHYGWAIEGAVGSEFKIDASYLSPNVSIAESVERATQIYGVSLLVAESVVSICSAAVAAKCRLIDRVIITGSVSPMDLYVIDLDHLSLTVEPPLGPQRFTNRDRFKVRQFLESEKERKMGDEVHMVDFFNENADIASMRFRYTLEFIHVFNMGYQNYSQGEWQVAQKMLLRTKEMLGVEDGPSVALLKFMETQNNFEAPEWWQGIRDLGHAALS
eukprot:TRINITY_DN106612_c0_g1_i1.p1 TRINITY_DN106612_c0_g1~~TRINITY_DN106612_c0_g1_i1.p1  ORF type:complete len:950 (+),score=237.21 TRINITY_DN106612_c0_g1_i1:43-2892(+)